MYLERVFGGLVFAAVYISWTRRSRRDAFVVVATAHFLHNLIALTVLLGGMIQ